jgi:hypothetical protein
MAHDADVRASIVSGTSDFPDDSDLLASVEGNPALLAPEPPPPPQAEPEAEDEPEAEAEDEPEAEAEPEPEPEPEDEPEPEAEPKALHAPEAPAATAGEPEASSSSGDPAADTNSSGGVVEAAAEQLNKPLQAAGEGLGSLARRLRGTKGPPGWNPKWDQGGNTIKPSVTFMCTLDTATAVTTPADSTAARSARICLVDQYGRVVSNFHSVGLPPDLQKEGSADWKFERKSAANTVCVAVPPEEDDDDDQKGSAVCIELLATPPAGAGAPERLAFAKLPLSECFRVVKASKSRKEVTLSPALCTGAVTSPAPAAGSTLAIVVSKALREHRADALRLPYYVVLPLSAAAGSVIFRTIATEESAARYADVANPDGAAATAQRERERGDDGGGGGGGADSTVELEPPPCSGPPLGAAAGPFYSTAMELIDSPDPSVFAAVAAAWKKQYGSMKKATKKEGAVVAAEFKAMLTKLWPLTQMRLPDTPEGNAQRIALIPKLLAGEHQALLLSADYAHRPFHTSELDPVAELTPIKSPSPPPSPKAENWYQVCHAICFTCS